MSNWIYRCLPVETADKLMNLAEENRVEYDIWNPEEVVMGGQTVKLGFKDWSNPALHEKPKRKNGYYWVKSRFNKGEWAVAYFEGKNWLLAGSDESFADNDFEVIGEEIKHNEKSP